MLRHDDLEKIDQNFEQRYSLKFGCCIKCQHRNAPFKSKNKMTEVELIYLDYYLTVLKNKMPEIRTMIPTKIKGLWYSVCLPCAKFIEVKDK